LFLYNECHLLHVIWDILLRSVSFLAANDCRISSPFYLWLCAYLMKNSSKIPKG